MVHESGVFRAVDHRDDVAALAADGLVRAGAVQYCTVGAVLVVVDVEGEGGEEGPVQPRL